MFVRHVKQSYSENLVVFSRWQVLYRFKPTQTLKRGQFLLELLVIYSWHLSDKHCKTCWYKHQLVNVSEVKCMLWKEFAHIVSKYKISISTTAIKMCCSAPKGGQHQLFCVDFFHYTVNNTYRLCAAISLLLITASLWLRKHCTQSSLVKGYSIMSHRMSRFQQDFLLWVILLA